MTVLAALATTLAPVAAGAATPGTTLRCATSTVLEGINVSDGQTVTSLASVKAAGKQFGYARALDGIAFPDTKFVEHYQGMKAAGIKPGGYLFFRTWVDPTTQAHLFIEQLQKAGYAPGDLVPVIDVEKDVNTTSPVVTRDEIVAKLRVVEDIVQDAIGTPPVIYTGPDYWAVELGNPSGFVANPLWIANYVPPPYTTCPEVPNSWGAWKYWQYKPDGSVPGITGAATNLNRSNGPLPIAPAVAPAFYENQQSPPTPASVGTPYTYRFGATGVPAPTYAVHSGTLPPGISLDGVTGALAGEPTTPGAYQFVVRAENGVGPNAVTLSLPLEILVAPPAAGFHSLVPYRVLDSRTTTGGWDEQLAKGADKALVVTGASGVPATASAVVMNVAVVESTKESFVTVYPGGAPKPVASNLNFGAGQINANLVTVRLGPGGVVQFSTAEGATNVVADIVGYYDDGSPGGELFNGVTPARILDSRVGNGWSAPLGEEQSRTLQVTGRGGIPAGATSVVMNVTVTDGTAQTFLQVWPTGATRPNSSSLNAQAGQVIPNLVTVKLGTGGAVSFFNAVGSINVIADVVGWYGATGDHFFSLPTPTRIVDSRVADGLAGRVAQSPRAVTVTGRDGIPVGASGLVTNVTVADGDSPSFLTVFPGNLGAAPNPGSNLNFGTNQVIPNLVVTKLPTSGAGTGQIKFFNNTGYVYVIADAVGYFAP